MLAVTPVQPTTILVTVVAIIIAAAVKNAVGGSSGKIKIAAIEIIAVVTDATAVVAAAADADALISAK